jgi:hypothetical protein
VKKNLSLRGVPATKQSLCSSKDCFAPLAMTASVNLERVCKLGDKRHCEERQRRSNLTEGKDGFAEFILSVAKGSQ